MKKKILATTFVMLLISGSSLFAQASYQTLCTLTVEEIQSEQAWDIDHPKSENIQNISIGLFTALNSINEDLSNGLPNDLSVYIEAIDSYILAAEELGMNYSMFDADLAFIETLN